MNDRNVIVWQPKTLQGILWCQSLSLSLSPSQNNERSYRLSEIDENSKAATTTVSLNIDPPSGIEITTSEQNRGRQKGVAIFDSERMPIVKLG